tara:strand:+ start:88 stop:966 length:879 start_codon:yes stop_codon:yes gene_type:complete
VNNCIVSQVHIPSHDPQGGITAEQKKNMVDLSISHLRKNNPGSYIILAGHGEDPYDSTVQQCDHVDWSPLSPIDGGGTVIGMPAQFVYVSKGIKHAREKGFKYCVKTRSDSLIGLPNIVDYCHGVLEEEGKDILLTQQTGNSLYKMGDCFMYGEIGLLDSMWDMDNPVFHADGLRNTGANFIKHFSGHLPPQEFSATHQYIDGMNWEQLLRAKCSFRDIFKIKFADFRWNYKRIESGGWQKSYDDIMNGEYDLNQILWGRTNGWHLFNSNGDLITNGSMCDWSYCEKTFYGG